MLLGHRELTLQEPEVVARALATFRRDPSLGFSDCLVVEGAARPGTGRSGPSIGASPGSKGSSGWAADPSRAPAGPPTKRRRHRRYRPDPQVPKGSVRLIICIMVTSRQAGKCLNPAVPVPHESIGSSRSSGLRRTPGSGVGRSAGRRLDAPPPPRRSHSRAGRAAPSRCAAPRRPRPPGTGSRPPPGPCSRSSTTSSEATDLAAHPAQPLQPALRLGQVPLQHLAELGGELAGGLAAPLRGSRIDWISRDDRPSSRRSTMSRSRSRSAGV